MNRKLTQIKKYCETYILKTIENDPADENRMARFKIKGLIIRIYTNHPGYKDTIIRELLRIERNTFGLYFDNFGFDVDVGPLFQTPEEAVKQAIENDVHVLGVSSLAAGHKTLIPEVIRLLADKGREDIMVVAGGVIPQQDYDFLYGQGVLGIFGPGTKIAIAAIDILGILMRFHEDGNVD